MAKYDHIIIELPQTDSRIGKHTEYEGRLRFKTSFSILGRFEGEVRGGTLLVIHPEARVVADIYADYVLIAGSVEGSIKASSGLYLYSGSIIRGSVESRLVRMQPGVDFEGSCNLIKKDDVDIFSASRNEFRARLADKLAHQSHIAS